jgi:hypothetical protein
MNQAVGALTTKLATTTAGIASKACLGFGVGSNHHKVNLAILEALARQAILSHFLEPVPVLAEIARSLLLRFEFRLQATSVARITVFNLKKDCLLSFYEILFGWQDMTHRVPS